ncbi:MAG: sugar ABC transporter permease [Gemmatimonadota bacterium]
MSRVIVRARFAAILACLLWAIASAAIVGVTGARVEYAQAAAEARTVVRLLAEAPERSPSPIRRLVAEGSLARVRVELARFLGHEVSGLESNDRVQVHRSWFKRVVSVPIKDRDAWDIMGAVALQAEPWGALYVPLLAILIVAALAAGLAFRGIDRLAAKPAASVYAAMIAPVAALSAVMAVISVTSRQRIDAAQVALPPLTALSRFDALALPLPSAVLSGIAMALVLLATSAALFVIGWAASAARRAADRRETLTAWAFLAPSALHLLLFTAGPLAFTLFISFHDWDLLRLDRPFVGLGNYLELVRDPLFWRALANTALYALYVPVSMALALGAALILNQPLRGMRTLRAVVFLPTVVSYVAIAVVWQWMFNVDYGLLNFLARSVHLPGVDWLGNPRTALIAVMIVSAWVQLGYQMVVYLAGLQGIPAHLLEAATLDGARRWARFRHITLPLLRPVTVFLFVTGIIWSFQVFTLVYVMTEGGPVHATDVLVYRIYQNAWEFRRMGYASAMSWVLFALLLGLTLLQWRALNRTVDDAA